MGQAGAWTCGSPSYAPISNHAATGSGGNRDRPSPSGWRTRAAKRCSGHSRQACSGGDDASHASGDDGGASDDGAGGSRSFRLPLRRARWRALPSRSAGSRQMLRWARAARLPRIAPADSRTYEACLPPCPSLGDPMRWCTQHFERAVRQAFMRSSRARHGTAFERTGRPSLEKAFRRLYNGQHPINACLEPHGRWRRTLLASTRLGCRLIAQNQSINWAPHGHDRIQHRQHKGAA